MVEGPTREDGDVGMRTLIYILVVIVLVLVVLSVLAYLYPWLAGYR